MYSIKKCNSIVKYERENLPFEEEQVRIIVLAREKISKYASGIPWSNLYCW